MLMAADLEHIAISRTMAAHFKLQYYAPYTEER